MLRYQTMIADIQEILSHHVPLMDGIELVQYDPHLHREVVPQVYKRTYHTRPWGDKWDAVEGFYPEGIFLLLNKEENYFVGFIISYVNEGLPYIGAIGVEEDFQGMHLGTCMVQSVALHYAKLGYKQLWVDVKPHSDGFFNRCIAMGFHTA